jgi:Na+/serine symporter
MAGSAVVTHVSDGGIRKVTFSWTSDASTGNVTGVSEVIHGKIIRVVTNPGATAPTANYDVVLNDADGVDVMGAALADRHTTTSEQVIPDPPVGVHGAISPVVTNAGNEKLGTIVIYVD